MKSEEIVDALIELRDIRGWTNYKIAVESGLPASTVSNIFKRKTMPQLDTLLAICNGFGISLVRLFEETEQHKILTDDESRIINLMENLNPETQTEIITLMKKLSYYLSNKQ